MNWRINIISRTVFLPNSAAGKQLPPVGRPDPSPPLGALGSGSPLGVSALNNVLKMTISWLISRVGKNPTTHLKNPTHLGFFGFFGFYWVLLGFLGFIGFNWVLLGFLHLLDLKLAFLTYKSLLLHGYSLFVIKKCIFTKSLHYIKPIRDQ